MPKETLKVSIVAIDEVGFTWAYVIVGDDHNDPAKKVPCGCLPAGIRENYPLIFAEWAALMTKLVEESVDRFGGVIINPENN